MVRNIMTTGEELELALSILRKYNMPVSPILEYAIRERVAESEDAPVPDEETPVAGKPGLVDTYIPTDGSIKENFERYLYGRKSYATARNYISYLNRNVRQFIAKLISPEADSVYSFATADAMRSVIAALKGSDEFMEFNARQHNYLTASMSAYLHFLEETETSAR